MQKSTSDISEKKKQAFDLFEKNEYKQTTDILLDIVDSAEDITVKNDICHKLGLSYYYLNDFDNSIRWYEKTLQYDTNNESVYNFLGYMYFNKDKEKSIKYYLEYLNLKPDIPTFSMIAQYVIRSATYSQSEIKSLFEHHVDILRDKLLENNKAFTYDKHELQKHKKLKIAYLSADLYSHAMMCFMLPIFENHNIKKFDFIIYASNENTDSVTERIKQAGFNIKYYTNSDNYNLAKLIHDDNVDILIDISGYMHTAVWSLIFKPAPVIMQYLGFVGTYGMKEVDYIITDKFTIPPEKAYLYTEKPLYLECGMNRFDFNTKNQLIPAITELPCLKNKYVTFGSFNCPTKINNYIISVWAKILKEIPTAKILIYRTQLRDNIKELLKNEFIKNGIGENRIIFDTTPTKPNHFTAYLKCDIALDPYPYSGLTIAIEENLMGVPVLSFSGDTFSSTGAARVNHTLGLDELNATNEEVYIQNAVSLANNIEKLHYFRNDLRKRIIYSPLMSNYKPYVKELEKHFVEVWEKKLNDLT